MGILPIHFIYFFDVISFTLWSWWLISNIFLLDPMLYFAIMIATLVLWPVSTCLNLYCWVLCVQGPVRLLARM